MPLQQTSGNVTADAYGGGVAAVPNYIEDIFSTYLYTGNGSTQTITNGIDLAGKGGLVWTKARTGTGNNHILFDSARNNFDNFICTDLTQAGTAFDAIDVSSTGFSFKSSAFNNSGTTYASWTFRKQPKFFDVVTYTGDGVSGRQIPHSLTSVPGCIIVKRTDTTSNWQVYHNGLTSAAYSIQLNLTNAQASATTVWNSTAPTSTVFSVGTDATVNASGGTYVAYLLAHNAGGFGLTGTDNVISCGSYTGNGSTNGPTVTLGYEPQWVMVKNAGPNTGGWPIMDNMRGMSVTDSLFLQAQSSSAEVDPAAPQVVPTATGFKLATAGAGFNNSGDTYIYIAIRRGPMKVPTDGTKVFAPVTATPSGTTTVTTNFPVDLAINTQRNKSVVTNTLVFDRLRGSSTTSSNYLFTDSTGTENASATFGMGLQSNTAMLDAVYNPVFGVTTPVVYWNFRRAPGFFDEVCYTGTGSTTAFNHNLNAVPELIIYKTRSIAGGWPVYAASQGITKYGSLSFDVAFATDTGGNLFGGVSPTLNQFTAGPSFCASGTTYVAYLFASCPGVSKVGSYTGNGSTQTINCGFAGGARFVLIKRTDSTGDWYVYDTARGMTTLTDPYLLMNSTAAETATLGSVTSVTTGFAVNAAVLAAINTNGASYIFLAIA